MRPGAAVLLALLLWPLDVSAQDATSTVVEKERTMPPSPPPVAEPPPPPARPLTPPTQQIATAPEGRLRLVPTQRQRDRWRRARIVSAIGTFTGIAGIGLSLSSAIYVSVKDYPPSANDVLAPSASPTDVGPVLAYTGASISAMSFLLTAGGLGAEHSVLRSLGIDPGRGRFGAATTLGVLGTLATGASYFFGFTNYLDPHDQAIAILTTSISGAVLCGVASIVYLSDSVRMKRAWKRLTTF